jgi:hypothetical protein
MSKLEFEKADVGCLLSKEDDGNSRGRIIGHMIELAVRAGYPWVPSDNLAVHAFFNGEKKFLDKFGIEHDVQEWVLGFGNLADSALEWINDNSAPEGTIFHWHDGNFYLSEKGEAPSAE